MTQRSREKRRWRRAQQEKDDNASAPAALVGNEALGSLPGAIGLFRDASRILSRPADVSAWRIPEGKYGASAFAWAWVLSTLAGLCGVLAYAFPIGRRYFNVRYLVLIPVSGSLLTFLVLAVAAFALKYLYGRRGQTRCQAALHGRLGLCFFWIPLTYLVFPVKLLQPGLERRPLWVAIALSAIAAAMVTRAGSPLVRRRDLAVAYILVAAPFFAAYALGPNMARALVRVLGL